MNKIIAHTSESYLKPKNFQPTYDSEEELEEIREQFDRTHFETLELQPYIKTRKGAENTLRPFYTENPKQKRKPDTDENKNLQKEQKKSENQPNTTKTVLMEIENS